MLIRKFAVALVCVCAAITSSANAEDSNGINSGKAPIYRSRSGGSGMVDTMRKSDATQLKDDVAEANVAQNPEITDTGRAMISKEAISKQAIDKDDSKPIKRRVPLSRSGGSASATYANMPE